MQKRKIFVFTIILIITSILNIYSQEEKRWEEKIWGYFWAAQHFFEKDELARAMELYKKTLELNPELFDSYYYISQIYKKLDKLGEAKEELKKMKNIFKNKAKIRPIMAELEYLNIDSEIKKIDEEIKERKKQKEKGKKLSWHEKLFKKEKEESLIGNKGKIMECLVERLQDDRLKIYKGRIDGLKEEQEIYLLEKKKNIAKISIIKVGEIFSEAKIEEVTQKFALPDKPKLLQIFIPE